LNLFKFSLTLDLGYTHTALLPVLSSVGGGRYRRTNWMRNNAPVNMKYF